MFKLILLIAVVMGLVWLLRYLALRDDDAVDPYETYFPTDESLRPPRLRVKNHPSVAKDPDPLEMAADFVRRHMPDDLD